jgi:hypothetical protein
MKILSKRTLCVSAIAVLSAAACKFVEATTFRIDVPSGSKVYDTASDGDRLVVARNDGLWFYKNGRFEKHLLMTVAVRQVADSTLTDRVWVMPEGLHMLGRYRVDSRGNPVGAAAEVDISDWDEVNDIAVGDGERLYLVGEYDGLPAIGTCTMSGDRCGDWTIQERRSDTGEFIGTPVRVAVDRTTDTVYVSASSEKQHILMSYKANLARTGKPALEVPFVSSLTADAKIVAAQTFTAQSETGKKAGLTLKLYSADGTQLIETDSKVVTTDNSVSGHATSDTCGELWAAAMSSGDLHLTRHEVCKPQN